MPEKCIHTKSELSERYCTVLLDDITQLFEYNFVYTPQWVTKPFRSFCEIIEFVPRIISGLEYFLLPIEQLEFTQFNSFIETFENVAHVFEPLYYLPAAEAVFTSYTPPTPEEVEVISRWCEAVLEIQRTALEPVEYEPFEMYVSVEENCTEPYVEMVLTRYISSFEHAHRWELNTFEAQLIAKEDINKHLLERVERIFYSTIWENLISSVGVPKEHYLLNLEMVFTSTPENILIYFGYCLAHEELQNSYGGTRTDWIISTRERCLGGEVNATVSEVYIVAQEAVIVQPSPVSFTSYVRTLEAVDTTSSTLFKAYISTKEVAKQPVEIESVIYLSTKEDVRNG